MISMWLKLIKSTPNPSPQLNQTKKNGLGLMANFFLIQFELYLDPGLTYLASIYSFRISQN